MRVLVLGLHGILGGSETYINNLIRCFDKSEIDFAFLVVGSDKTPYEDSINEFYGDGKKRFFYCPNLKKEYLKGKQWLKRFYNENKFDLIYLNATSAANAIYCQYALNKQHIPMITHSHFSNGPKVNHLLYRPYTLKKTFFKLACSELAAKWMFGKYSSDAILIPNGIDTNRFSFNEQYRNEVRAELGVSREKIILGHVGRFSVEKNHTFFVELCKNLPENYVFLCIGDGHCKEAFVEKVKNADLESRFIILPVKNDVERYYSAMDIFLLPSLYEGLPIVSVEAQCSGLNVIFSHTISQQADLSGKCYFEELNNAYAWAERVKSINHTRYDGVSCIRKSGFGIQEVSEQIKELFYKAIE